MTAQTPMATGLAPLDAALAGGFFAGVASLVASTAPMPSIALFLQTALTAMRRGTPVAIYSERFSEAQLRGHMVLLVAEVNRYRWQAGLLEPAEQLTLERLRGQIPWNLLHFQCGNDLTVERLEREWKRARVPLLLADFKPRLSSRDDPRRFATLMAGAEALSAWARAHHLAVLLRMGLAPEAAPPTLQSLPGAGRFAAPFGTVLLLQRQTDGGVNVSIPHAYRVGSERPQLTLNFDERFDKFT